VGRWPSWGGDGQFHLLEQAGVAFASVRFEAHYGLNSDIAPCPENADSFEKVFFS
jgi:hypothetical protein